MWTPLPGLDIRGAVVATGAASGSTIVLLGADKVTGALASWTSTDGSHWERHWLDGASFGGGMPSAVVAGGPGFVALGWNVDPRLRLTPVAWSSPDGIVWARDPDATGSFDSQRFTVAASGSSMVVGTCCDASGRFGRPTLWTSSNGDRWVATTLPTADNVGPVHLAANADGYLALSLVADAAGNEGMAIAAWRSVDGRTWQRDPNLDDSLRRHMSNVEEVLGTAHEFTVVGDGRPYAVAVDGSVTPISPPASSTTPSSGGAAGLLWLAAPDIGACLAGFAQASDIQQAIPTPSGACASSGGLDRIIPVSDGWLVVTPGAAAGADTVWAILPAGRIVTVAPPTDPAPTPPASSIPALPTGPLTAHGTCPAEPVSVAKVIALDGNDRVACFGSRAITFRAWVVDPGEGYGGTCEPLKPAWLLDCVLPDWLLAPAKGSDTQLRALKPPHATGDMKGVSRWVNVSGHFDDPAASSCRLEGGPAVAGVPPVGWYVLRCREMFVVTRIRTTQ